MATHNDLGQWGEQTAAEYLERNGLRIVERNWRDRHRDIDIVAIDADTLVFVEVKTRKKGSAMPGELSVDNDKIHSLTLAANSFVKRYSVNCNIRFDIIAICGGPGDYEIKHIEDAFYPRL